MANRFCLVFVWFLLFGFVCASEKGLVNDIVIEDEFEQIKGFSQVGFSLDSKDASVNRFAGFFVLSDETLEFDRENINSSRNNFRNRFSSDGISVESVHEEVDSGFFNVDEKAVKQTYIIRNEEDVVKNVALNVVYEIDSNFVVWNGVNYSIGEEAVYFEAFEIEIEVFPGFNETTWAGHALYFGNNYYDFRDVIGMDYSVFVYALDGRNYIGLEIHGNVDGLSELVVDPVIGWTEHVIDSGINSPLEIFAIDLDLDGDVDVVSGSNEGDGISWYENNGNEIFVSHIVSFEETYVFPIDLDSDGDIDIVSSDDYPVAKISWYENDGDENFVEHSVITSRKKIRYVFPVDLDSDGDIDMVSSGADTELAWYENDGNEGFLEYNITFPKCWGSGDISVADLNSDGYLDILAAHGYYGVFQNATVVWYENDRESNFVERIILSVPEGGIIENAVDLDSDGDIDVVVSFWSGNRLEWYENDGSGNFSAHDIEGSEAGTSGYFSDLDSDGDMDMIFVGGSRSGIVWYENNGSEFFVKHVISSMLRFWNVYVEDLDSDEDLDVITSMATRPGNIFWFESNFSSGSSFCDGMVNVFAEDSSGDSMVGLSVYLNGENAGKTDVDGFLGHGVVGNCDAVFEVEVFCSDEVSSCGLGKSVIGVDGDLDSMTFICDVCRKDKDVFILEEEINFNGLGVDVLVHSIGMNEDVEVSLIKSCRGIKSLVENKSVFVSSMETEVVSFVEDFEGCEKVDVLLGNFEEEDSFENNAIRDFFIIEPVKVYLEVDSGYTYVDSVIKEFLGGHVEIVSSKSEADLEVYVGKKLYREASVGVDYLDDELIRFQGRKEGLPWNGLIQQGVFDLGNKVYVFGNEIDGTVASVKRLVLERENYLNRRMLGRDMGEVYLGSRDMMAVGVFDYLHTEENIKNYKKDNEGFGEVVESVLRERTFNLEIKRVLTSEDNVVLRMKHLGSEYSSGFRSIVGTRPVVMAGGLFSDLTMWEDGGDGLAVDLAESGKDVWEIEITGGSGTECEDCIDYTYEDLVDSYWPALIGGVQYYSGVVGVDYVGHSNGCRVALSSLSRYQESGLQDVGSVDGVLVDLEGGDVVERFVGVGCPAELNDETFLSTVAREEFNGGNAGDVAMGLIADNHIKMSGYAGRLAVLGILDKSFYGSLASLAVMFSGDEKISRNLMGYYNGLAVEEDSDFDLSGLEIEKLRLYYGNMLFLGHDGVVPVEDMDVILSYGNGQDWSGKPYPGILFDVDHVFIKNKNNVKKKILEDLK